MLICDGNGVCHTVIPIPSVASQVYIPPLWALQACSRAWSTNTSQPSAWKRSHQATSSHLFMFFPDGAALRDMQCACMAMLALKNSVHSPDQAAQVK